MALKPETARRELQQVGVAAVDLEDALTGSAAEVMVVPFARYLVTRRLAGQGNRLQPAFFDQCLDVAVHRSDTQARGIRLSGRKDLLGAQRAVDFFEYSSYRLALSGFAFHGRTIHEAPGRSNRGAVRCRSHKPLISLHSRRILT